MVGTKVTMAPTLNRGYRSGHEIRCMSFVERRALGCRMLGVRWCAGWNSVPKARQRPFSIWVRR
jgi:hypothetical protein